MPTTVAVKLRPSCSDLDGGGARTVVIDRVVALGRVDDRQADALAAGATRLAEAATARRRPGRKCSPLPASRVRASAPATDATVCHGQGGARRHGKSGVARGWRRGAGAADMNQFAGAFRVLRRNIAARRTSRDRSSPDGVFATFHFSPEADRLPVRRESDTAT